MSNEVKTQNHLSWLRAGVLGSNDGIVSVAAVAIGVAGATAAPHAILLAGLAALIGGAVSMALGEYVSVSTQLDSQRASDIPRSEFVSPWHAAVVSAITFLIGGLIPLAAIVLLPAVVRIPITAVIVLVLLGFTGGLGAHLGGSPKLRPIIRVILGGALALTATYLLGLLFGVFNL